jgi:hypothetical protein
VFLRQRGIETLLRPNSQLERVAWDAHAFE